MFKMYNEYSKTLFKFSLLCKHKVLFKSTVLTNIKRRKTFRQTLAAKLE